MADVRKLEPDEVVTVAAGLLAFLASFLPWVDVSGFSASAWRDSLFPTYTWVGIVGLALALLVILPLVSTVRIPPVVAGFTIHQVHLLLAGLALLLSVSFLIAGQEHGAGFWLSFLASIALFVTAVIHKNKPAPTEQAPTEGGPL